MDINGKPKTPIIAAQSKKKNGPGDDPAALETGGTKARASRKSTKKSDGVKLAVLDRISDGILALDAGLNYAYLNERAGELLGCKPGDLIGKPLWQVHPEVETTAFAEACRRALETQSVVMLDGYFPFTDRWLEGRVYPSEDGVSVLFSEGEPREPQAREENRRREERYRILFDTMHEGFLLAEVVTANSGEQLDARFLEVNASMTRFFARSRDELVGKTVREVFLLDEEDHEVLGSACRVALGESEPFFLERYEAAAGRWLRAHVFSPRTGQFASLVTDITEQKQAEQKLQDVSKIPGQNPNPVLRFNRQGEILYANQASEALLTAWQNPEEHITPLGEILEMLPSVMEEGENTEIEVANEGMFYAGLLVPVREEGYINLYLRDITQRKQVEESLSAHIHQSNAGITRSDLEGRFIFVNQAFCEMLGYSESELVGKTIWEISHPDDISRNKILFETMVRQGEPFQLEKRLVRRNGSILWINVGTSPLRDASGRILAATSIIVDITRRKRAEESLLDGARRTLYLSSLSDNLRSISDPAEMQIEAVRLLGTHLQASRVAYAEIEPEDNAFVSDSYVDGVPEIIGRFDLASSLPRESMSRFREGRLLTVSDVQTDSRFSEEQKAAQETLSVQAQVVIPLLRNGDLVAALYIQQDRPRIWSNEEVALIQETAERLQAAIERVQAERQLRESEQRLRVKEAELEEIIHHTPFLLTRCTRDLHYRFASRAYAELLGRTPEEIVGRSIGEIMGEEGLETIRPYVEQVLNGERVEYEARVPFESAVAPWLHVIYTPDRDEHDQVVGWFASIVDVSERRQMEEELRESERKFSLIYDRLPYAASLLRPQDGVIMDVNQEFERIFGFAKQEAVGRTSRELGIQPSGEQQALVLSELQTHISLRDMEVTVATRPLGPRVFLLNVDPVNIGGTDYIIQTAQDITERALAAEWERRSAEANAKFRTFFDQGSYFAGVMTLDGTLVEANRLSLDFCGFTKEDVIGRKFWDCGWWNPSPELMEMVRQGTQQAVKGQLFRTESKYYVADGSERYVDLIIAPIRDEHGKILFLAPSGTDITERKKMEDAIRQSEERFRAIVSQTTAGIAQSAPDGTVTFANPRFCEMLGYSEEELPGRNLWDLTYSEDLAENKRLFQQMLEQGRPYQFEKRFVRRDGSLLWAHVSVTSINDLNGKPVSGLGVVIDVEERKQAEQAILEYGRQQEALYQLADRLNRSESLGDVFDPALDAILQALQCDRASILLFDEMDVMRFVAWRGLSDAYRQATEGHSPWKPDTKEPEPVIMEDVSQAELGDALQKVIQEEGIGALAFIPLVSNEKLIGKFMVYYNKPHPLEEAELEIGLTIARQLAAHIDRKRAEQALRESEERFREIFETAGVSVWVEDFSEVKADIEELRRQGVRDFRSYFSQHPDFVRRAVELIRILDVNNETVDLFNASSKADMLRSLNEIFTPETEPVFIQELVALAEGHEMLRSEAKCQTLDGQPLTVIFTVHFNPHAADYSRVVVTVADITAHKQAEEELQQSEERFGRFMQHLPGLAWIKDIEGRYVFANAAAEKAFGTLREQLYGRTDEEVFTPEVAAQFKENDRQALVDEKGIQAVETLQHDDGVLHYSLVNKFPIPGPEGSPILIGGTAFDITERIQIEEALETSRQKAEGTANRMVRLQKVTAALSEAQTPLQAARVIVDEGAPALDAATSSLVILDEDNQTLEIIYTAAEEELVRPYLRFPLSLNVPAADAIRSGQPVWIDSRQNYMERYPHLVDQIDEWGHEAAMAIPMTYKGKTLGALTLSFDRVITSLEDREYALTLARQGAQALERARSENALRESEERYRAILSQATAGIVRKDPAGRLLFVNQAFCNMLDQTDSELIGRTMWELTHPEDAEENKRLYQRLMEEGTPFQLEKRLLRRDGSPLWANVSVSPLMDSSGKPQSAVSVYVNVTRRKQAENRLTLLARISELAREFEDPGELLYTVSQAVGEHFQARRVFFNEIDLENDREVVQRDYCRGVHSVTGVHRVSEYNSITTAEMMVGKTVVNHDSRTDPRTAQDYERVYVEHGERAYVAVPLMHEDRWAASLWISDDKPRPWDPDDVYLLEAIAERTWTAAEKMRVARALRDSEERLRVTFNTTAVGFATLTPETRFVEVNEAFCRIVGYSREELLGMNFEALTHPDYLKSTQDHIGQLLAGEVASVVIEKLYVRKDGTEIWVQNSISLVRDEAGYPLHLITISQDVTERKRADQQLHQLNVELEQRVLRRTVELQSAYEFLRESEATSRLILESMPDAIVITDREGRIVHANTQVESLFGYLPSEVLGQPVEILLPERFRRQHVENRNTFTDNQSRRIMGLGLDLFGRRKDRSEFSVDVMLSPIDNNTTWDVMVAIRDNTKQRQAQEALRTNEEKLRTLFEILPVGISFLGKDGRIVDMNPALSEILGLSKQAIVQGAFKARRYIRADGTPMPPSEFASRRAVMEGITIYNVETGIVHENGEIKWTSVNAAPVRVADVEAVVVTVDITKRKQAEEAVHRHRESLKLLSRRLVEIQEEERRAIARELHDRVGQNLAALTLNLNILRSQLDSEILQKVGTRLSDSVNLVKDVLTITRSVMADLRPNVLDDYGLDAALNEYADRFSQRFGIRVTNYVPATPTSRLDPGIEMTLLRIAQEALTNIARHAQASQASISLEVEEDVAHMSIEDNGIGILSWQKVNQPGSHGMRIMRERAEAFGGTLKVHSAYKNGTKIEVRIPLGGSAARSRAAQEESS